MENGVRLEVYLHDFKVPSGRSKVKWCLFVSGYVVDVRSVLEKDLAVDRSCLSTRQATKCTGYKPPPFQRLSNGLPDAEQSIHQPISG